MDFCADHPRQGGAAGSPSPLNVAATPEASGQPLASTFLGGRSAESAATLANQPTIQTRPLPGPNSVRSALFQPIRHADEPGTTVQFHPGEIFPPHPLAQNCPGHPGHAYRFAGPSVVEFGRRTWQ